MPRSHSGGAIAPHRKVPRGRIVSRGKAPTRRTRGAAPQRGTARRRRSGGDDHRTRAAMDSAATMALVLGLVSFLVLPLVGPFAIMKGNEAGRLARRIRVAVPGTATAGLILGWLATIGMILGVLAIALIFVIAIGASAA